MIRQQMKKSISVLIAGAGPNGLAAATFLKAAGAEVFIHGKPMESWKVNVPEGMILRSSRVSSSIASPGERYSINRFEADTGIKVDQQPTLAQFLMYSAWYQQCSVPYLDETRVKTIEKTPAGFRSTLEDGRTVDTDAVILATGIIPYPYIPEIFAALPARLASHSSAHHTLEGFKGKKVIVIGKGQSALETAALLAETGASVEIITRGRELRFIQSGKRKGVVPYLTSLPAIHQFLYPRTDLAGPPYNWAIADPALYRRISKADQAKTFELVGPIGSRDLPARLAGVRVTTGVEVVEAAERGDQASLRLSDGSTREADHVILATGFRPDIRRCGILSLDLLASIEQEQGYPLLTLGYESISVKGLYVVGALAGRSNGPVNRFVCGTRPMTRYLAEAVMGSKLGYPRGIERVYIAGRRLGFSAARLAGLTRRR